jgi:hypothetical protein
MNDSQRFVWKLRIRNWLITTACILICTAGSSLVNVLLLRRIPWHFVLVLGFAAGMFLDFAYWMVEYYRLRREEELSQAKERLPLTKFLKKRHAIIAPNFQEQSGAIARWLTDFATRHGPDSVYVGFDVDEPHISDEVFLIVPQLAEEDRRTLLSFHADGVTTLTKKKMQRLFPHVQPPSRVFSAVWD